MSPIDVLSRGGFWENKRGIAAVEFAFIMPALLSLVFGGFEVTRFARASLRLNDAAQTFADLVSQQTSVTAAGMSNFCTGSRLVMTPFPTTTLGSTAASVTRYSTGISVDWQDTTCGGQAIPAVAALADPYLTGIGDSVIVVQSSYIYQPVATALLGSSTTVSMVKTAISRPRTGSTLTHY